MTTVAPYVSSRASLVVYDDPNCEPITVQEARAWLRVHEDDTSHDDIIAALIVAAREKVENHTRLSLITRTLDQTVDRFPCGAEPLPLAAFPLQEVTSITSYASDDTVSTFDDASYFVDTSAIPGRVCLTSGSSWPSGLRPYLAGVVRFVAGYGDTSTSVPTSLMLAMRLCIGYWFEHPETAGGPLSENYERAFCALVDPFVVHFVGHEV